MGKAQVTVPLDIADVRVLRTEINEKEELIITIESTKAGTRCGKCGGRSQNRMGGMMGDGTATCRCLGGRRICAIAEALSMFGLRRAADDHQGTGMAGYEQYAQRGLR